MINKRIKLILNSIFLVIASITLTTCAKFDPEPTSGLKGPLPTVTTTAVSLIESFSAISGGSVENTIGTFAVISKGVCWNTSENPTIDNNKTIDGSGTGTYISSVTGLDDEQTYYLRAYATNSLGTAYGEQISFTTPPKIFTFCEALDDCNLSFYADNSWSTQTEIKYYGEAAVQSGSIGNSESTSVEVTVTGPGTLTFFWKVSSEATYDDLNFYHVQNAEELQVISGEVEWVGWDYTLYDAVSYTFRWTYSKDASTDSGSDAAWLDYIVYAQGKKKQALPQSLDGKHISLSGKQRNYVEKSN
jgi:hypothetical protein